VNSNSMKKKIHKVVLNKCGTNAMRFGGIIKNLGHGSRRRAEKKARLQLVDVFITMDSGGVFIFAFASEEDEEEEAAEKEETK